MGKTLATINGIGLQIPLKELQQYGMQPGMRVTVEFGSEHILVTLPGKAPQEDKQDEFKTDISERAAEATRFPEFEQEILAFEEMKLELLKEFPGQAVAIFQGKVVATGSSKMDALRNAEKLMGPIHCYVEWVEPGSPRRVLSPSVFVKR